MMIMRRVIQRLAPAQRKARKKRKPFYMDLIFLFIIVGGACLLLLLSRPAYAASLAAALPGRGAHPQNHALAPAPVQALNSQGTTQARQPGGVCDGLTGTDYLNCQAQNGGGVSFGCQYVTLTSAAECFNAQQNTQIQNPIAQGSALFYLTPVDTSGQIDFFWKIMLGIVDLFVVVAIMLNGIRIMLAGSVFRYADAVEGIPGMLFALIAAHVSMVFIIFFLALNNSLTGSLYVMANQNLTKTTDVVTQQQTFNFAQGQQAAYENLPPDVKATCKASQVPYEEAYTTVETCQVPVKNLADFQLVPSDLNFTDFWSNFSSLGAALALIDKVLALMLLGQMIIRLFFINLYIVFSPVAIACWALPGKTGQPLTRMWFSGFLSTVLVQFLMVGALIVTQIMLGVVMKFASNGVAPGHLDQSTMVSLIQVACMWFIVRIPSLLATSIHSPVRTMTEAGGAMSQAVGASIALQFAQIQGIATAVTSGISIAGTLAR